MRKVGSISITIFTILLSLWISHEVVAQPVSGLDKQKSKECILRGISLQAEARLKEAAEQYRQAIQLNPQSAAAHNNLAVVLKEMQMLTAAESEAKLALKIKPGRADYSFNLGIILQRLNKLEEAETTLKQAVRLNPLDAEAHFHLVQVLLSQNKYADALEEARLALALKPNAAKYHRLVGDCKFKVGDNEAALCEYRTALECDSQSSDAGDIRNKIDYLQQLLGEAK